MSYRRVMAVQIVVKSASRMPATRPVSGLLPSHGLAQSDRKACKVKSGLWQIIVTTSRPDISHGLLPVHSPLASLGTWGLVSLTRRFQTSITGSMRGRRWQVRNPIHFSRRTWLPISIAFWKRCSGWRVGWNQESKKWSGAGLVCGQGIYAAGSEYVY
jgi:hypothetical protein